MNSATVINIVRFYQTRNGRNGVVYTVNGEKASTFLSAHDFMTMQVANIKGGMNDAAEVLAGVLGVCTAWNLSATVERVATFLVHNAMWGEDNDYVATNEGVRFWRNLPFRENLGSLTVAQDGAVTVHTFRTHNRYNLLARKASGALNILSDLGLNVTITHH